MSNKEVRFKQKCDYCDGDNHIEEKCWQKAFDNKMSQLSNSNGGETQAKFAHHVSSHTKENQVKVGLVIIHFAHTVSFQKSKSYIELLTPYDKTHARRKMVFYQLRSLRGYGNVPIIFLFSI